MTFKTWFLMSAGIILMLNIMIGYLFTKTTGDTDAEFIIYALRIIYILFVPVVVLFCGLVMDSNDRKYKSRQK